MPATHSKAFYEIVRSVPKGRWNGIQRNYTAHEVLKLRGSMNVEHTLATAGANKLWNLMANDDYVPALGALSGNQAMQMVRAGLKAIYLSGWQVAADANTAGSMYPDQSLYPANSGPELARRINRALQRAEQVEFIEREDNRIEYTEKPQRDWYAPIVADAEAGFGGPLNCFEIMKAYIEAGVAGVHYEDQLASEKKCGHLGGKVLIPTLAHIRNLNAARLAADVCGVPTVLVSRTDAESATLITSEIDERDREFIDFEAGRTSEGFYRLKKKTGLQHCIRRGLSCAPFADLLWWETSTPNLQHAKEFAEAIHEAFPGKMMAYNCSPSFNWEANLSRKDIANFHRELGAMGYKFQFITLAGFHSLNYGIFTLAKDYNERGMLAYSDLQQKEFAAQKHGYTAVRHQREVGTGYFDLVAMAAAGGLSSTTALGQSTEKAQFKNGESPMQKIIQQSAEKVAAAVPPPLQEQRQITRESRAGYATQAAVARKEEEHREWSIGGATLTMPIVNGDRRVLTEEAVQFLVSLHNKFDGKRQQLLQNRLLRQAKLDAGEMPDFAAQTLEIRRNPDWRIAKTPFDLQDRKVEITGPVDRKMVINALNSGAQTYMADFEDSTTPTWRNLIDGQNNLYDAVRRQLFHEDKQSGKKYVLNPNTAVLLVRPRGWHLPEKHLLVDGKPMSGSLFDFGLYFFHNARELLETDTAPYFYLPKMQSHKEAELWNDVFNFSQDKLGIPRGTIKATVLLEHVLATFEAQEILYALKDHIVGLNCGRWDYIFSYIKSFRNHKKFLLPNRFDVNMTVPFMRNYSLYTIKTCHARGAHAMGGMAAQIPIKNNEAENKKALDLVQQDKVREASDGHDGTWVAHPGLVDIAAKAFEQQLGDRPNQVDRLRPDVNPSAADLLAVPQGSRTEAGLRKNVNVTLGYLESWLRGTGCVPLYNLMEDAATAEISRTQLWQWLHHGAQLEDGRKVDHALVSQIVGEERQSLAKAAKGPNRLEDAAQLLLELIESKDLPDFLTLPAYDILLTETNKPVDVKEVQIKPEDSTVAESHSITHETPTTTTTTKITVEKVVHTKSESV